MVCTHWHTMVVKFLIINLNNLLGDDLQDESVVESTVLAQTKKKLSLVTIDLPFINQLLEKKGRESPVPPIILLWVNKSMYRELTPCCYELSNSTESKHNSLPLLCGYCKSYWTSQVHAFWRGAQQEQTDRLTLLSTRLYDFILFNGRYFIHFDNWRACLWVSRWWERLLEFVLSAPLLRFWF